MIVGRFDGRERPRIRGVIYIPRFAIRGRVWFLLDTGSDVTTVGASDVTYLHIPRERLSVPTGISGVGGSGYFSTEKAYVAFEDEPDNTQFNVYEIDLYITRSETGSLPSLLGRNIINRWRIDYDPLDGKLECEVRSDDSAA